MPYKDAEKRREYNRRYYNDVDKKNQQRRVRARKRQLYAEYHAWKSTKYCLKCGENDPACLEFHHIDPATKDIDPGNLVGQRGWSIDRIAAHLETTCICLCSNCHKKIHRDLREIEKKRNELTARPPARKPRRRLLP